MLIQRWPNRPDNMGQPLINYNNYLMFSLGSRRVSDDGPHHDGVVTVSRSVLFMARIIKLRVQCGESNRRVLYSNTSTVRL